MSSALNMSLALQTRKGTEVTAPTMNRLAVELCFIELKNYKAKKHWSELQELGVHDLALSQTSCVTLSKLLN